MHDLRTRCTARGLKVLGFAEEEAILHNHPSIGSEHILLGLLREGEGYAYQALASLGVTVQEARCEVLSIMLRGTERVNAALRYTPLAKQLLERADAERERRQDDLIDTGHILLGLLHQRTGVGYSALSKMVAIERVREALDRELTGSHA